MRKTGPSETRETTQRTHEDEEGEEEGEGDEDADSNATSEPDSVDDEDEDEEEMGANYSDLPGNDSGCTAVVGLLRASTLYVANAGDSRCVVCRDGQAVEMSFDHKPEDEPEMKRIEAAGGKVTPDGRVNGGLNLSRAIGDHTYKTRKALPLQEQMISPVPDIRTLKLDAKRDSFIILACDGIWNSLSSQETVDFVQERLSKLESKDPSTAELRGICEQLFDHCLAPDTVGDGTGCDNMTAVLVKLRPAFENKPETLPTPETSPQTSSSSSSQPTKSSEEEDASSVATSSEKPETEVPKTNGQPKEEEEAEASSESSANKRPSSPPAKSNAAKKLKTDTSAATPETPTSAPATANGDS